MPGEFGSPYRAPCGGWPESPRRWLRNHTKPQNAVPRFENITKLRDWNDLDTYVAIYPLEFQECGASCTQVACDSTHNPTEGVQPCYGIHLDTTAKAYWLKPCSPEAPGDSVSTFADNCWKALKDAETGIALRTTDPCRKIGFKAVQAEKLWHGSTGLSNCCERWESWSDCENWNRVNATPSDAHYLATSYGIYIRHYIPGEQDWVFQSTNSFNTDRFSGEVSLTGCTYRWDVEGYDADEAYKWFAEDVPAYDLSNICEAIDVLRWAYCYHSGIYSEPTDPFSVHVTGPYQWELRINAPGDPNHGFVTDRHTLTMSNTGIHFEWNSYGTDGRFILRQWWHTMDRPYTSELLAMDLGAMLAHWDLKDDVLLPWRTDDYGTVAPLVTYDEVYGNPDVGFEVCTVDDKRSPIQDALGNDPFTEFWSPTYAQMPWKDMNVWNFFWNPGESEATHAAAGLRKTVTGELRGQPLPKGYEGFWDWDHPTYCLGDEITEAYCLTSYGAMSGVSDAGDATDAVAPKSATRWTDNYTAGAESGYRRRGAWYVLSQSAGLMQKWAETLLPWPSINFARPCGIDRGMLMGYSVEDEGYYSDCINTGSSTFPNIVTEGDPLIVTNDYCAVHWDAYDGIYRVTKTGTGTYGLGSKLWEVPAWVSAPANGRRQWHANTIAKLRWWTQRGICKTVNVTAATDNEDGTVEITVDADVYLVGRPIGSGSGGESLDFTGVTGLGAATEVISVDGTEPLRTFTVAGALSGAYTSGGSVVSAGAGTTYDAWFDDNTKRDYVTREYNENAYDAEDGHTWTVTETQRCMFPVPCSPSVVCITPNASDAGWANGLLIPFPNPDAYQNVDACHVPWVWAADVLQAEADPFWHTPPGPCAEDAWNMDDGSCAADVGGENSIQYYEHVPMTEPRLTLPSGAPSLIAGVTLHTAATSPASTVGFESGTATPRGSGLIHTFWLLIHAATEECRFAYHTWRRSC